MWNRKHKTWISVKKHNFILLKALLWQGEASNQKETLPWRWCCKIHSRTAEGRHFKKKTCHVNETGGNITVTDPLTCSRNNKQQSILGHLAFMNAPSFGNSFGNVNCPYNSSLASVALTTPRNNSGDVTTPRWKHEYITYSSISWYITKWTHRQAMNGGDSCWHGLWFDLRSALACDYYGEEINVTSQVY